MVCNLSTFWTLLKKWTPQKVYNWQFWTPSFLILAKTSLGEIVELNHRYYNIRDKKVLEELFENSELGSDEYLLEISSHAKKCQRIANDMQPYTS